VLDDMMAVNAALSKGRKKRAVPDSVASPEDIAGYTLLGSHALHSARTGGVNDIDLHPQQVGRRGLGARGRAVARARLAAAFGVCGPSATCRAQHAPAPCSRAPAGERRRDRRHGLDGAAV
jgi:hypothetical protein